MTEPELTTQPWTEDQWVDAFDSWFKVAGFAMLNIVKSVVRRDDRREAARHMARMVMAAAREAADPSA